VAAYFKHAKAHGLSDSDAPKVFAALAWSEILTVVRFMNHVGARNITAKSLAAQARSFRGPMIMGPPDIRCGQFKDAPAICNDETQFYRYLGGGHWQRASGWLKPPK
jgi:branched-chain amino acid transport system substrate-binding protein